MNETIDSPRTESGVGIQAWLDRIRSEYREMPRLNLTKAQMQRLWGFDAFVCDALIDALVSARVLRRTVTGEYVAFGSAH